MSLVRKTWAIDGGLSYCETDLDRDRTTLGGCYARIANSFIQPLLSPELSNVYTQGTGMWLGAQNVGHRLLNGTVWRRRQQTEQRVTGV
jgi:hypothetical protein